MEWAKPWRFSIQCLADLQDSYPIMSSFALPAEAMLKYLKVIAVIYFNVKRPFPFIFVIGQLASLKSMIAKLIASFRIDCCQVNSVALSPFEARSYR